ncbi:MAG: FkbM family methyltransferase [Candidatus Micrarchaeota archaeon]|nr:FkbM family methyltransferase [Candidatus Micrarchaeota archaeon]
MSILVKALSKLTHDNSGSLDFLHKTVANWHEVLMLLAGARSGMNVKLRNGRSYSISAAGGNVVSDYKGRKLKFAYSTKDERIHAILMTIGEFFDEPHGELDVNGRIVVDIGAYIGDTAIYFALEGAKHVYGFEPYPYSYELAKKNINANALGKKITMVNAGCGGKRGAIKISSDYRNLAGSELRSSGSGKSIPILSLDDIVKRYRLNGAALKIDCEGCEYDIVLKSKRETLRKFKSILIEYHYNYPKLEKRLRESGFNVRHTKPERMKNANAENKEMYGGTIFAELSGKR